jgi:hypothetical protein
VPPTADAMATGVGPTREERLPQAEPGPEAKPEPPASPEWLAALGVDPHRAERLVLRRLEQESPSSIVDLVARTVRAQSGAWAALTRVLCLVEICEPLDIEVERWLTTNIAEWRTDPGHEEAAVQPLRVSPPQANKITQLLGSALESFEEIPEEALAAAAEAFGGVLDPGAARRRAEVDHELEEFWLREHQWREQRDWLKRYRRNG